MPTFNRAADLVGWLHDEYLSELLLRKISPKPGRRLPRAGVVSLEWGLVIGETKLQIYRARADGVTTWALDGAWDKAAACELHEIEDRPAGLSLVQRAPGTLSLVCERITVERGPERRLTLPPRPDSSSLLVWGDLEVSWSDLLAWIAPPPDLRLFIQRPGRNLLLDPERASEPIRSPTLGMFRLQRDADAEEPWLWICWALAITRVGHYFSLIRGTLDDPSWARMQRLPAHLGPCTVRSGTIRVTGEEWLERWTTPGGGTGNS